MKDLHKKSIGDLQKSLKELRQKLLSFRFDSATSQIKNVKTARNLKRDIARILTEINKRVKSDNK